MNLTFICKILQYLKAILSHIYIYIETCEFFVVKQNFTDTNLYILYRKSFTGNISGPMTNFGGSEGGFRLSTFPATCMRPYSSITGLLSSWSGTLCVWDKLTRFMNRKNISLRKYTNLSNIIENQNNSNLNSFEASIKLLY